MVQGRKLATYLRVGLKQNYGNRSEKLVEFGLQPLRIRHKAADTPTAKPKSSAPSTTIPSTTKPASSTEAPAPAGPGQSIDLPARRSGFCDVASHIGEVPFP